jgi:hypothetical protein
MENRPSLTSSFIIRRHDSPTGGERQALMGHDFVQRPLNNLHPKNPAEVFDYRCNA